MFDCPLEVDGTVAAVNVFELTGLRMESGERWCMENVLAWENGVCS